MATGVTTVLVTGSGGFLGKNLMQVLSSRDDIRPLEYEVYHSRSYLTQALARADVVVHLAGVNRPQRTDAYETGNVGLTTLICDELRRLGRSPKVIMSSTIQAELDNPYGISKRRAEEELRRFSEDMGAEVVVFRFKNIFGKWSRPNYNSVVATFCHNIARGLPVDVSDPNRELELVYVDDVIEAIVEEIDRAQSRPGFRLANEIPGFKITLGELARRIRYFRENRSTCVLPDLSDRFTRALYATYVSYLDGTGLAYQLVPKADHRGTLAEFIKSSHMGQVFVSRTKPGVTRGNHYHHTKAEKFLVVEGCGLIRLRHLKTGEVLEYEVNGEDFTVVDIPPGYAHSIENTGSTDMVVIFWATEVFNPQCPDTFLCEVGNEQAKGHDSRWDPSGDHPSVQSDGGT